MVCWLYRHYDANGVLLYVGITFDFRQRKRQHTSQSSWRTRIARMTVEVFPDRVAAREAERAAIVAENPIFNKQDKRKKIIGYRLPKSRITRMVALGECSIIDSDDDLDLGFVALAPSGSSVGTYHSIEEAEKGLRNVYGDDMQIIYRTRHAQT